jgi:hypothetical protein
MNSWTTADEIEKVKPLTDRRRQERLAAFDGLIERLKKQPHYAPCLRASYHPRGECMCWMALAIEFIEAAKTELQPKAVSA